MHEQPAAVRRTTVIHRCSRRPQKGLWPSWTQRPGGSEYDLEGRNLKGPARRPLAQYRVRLEAGAIRVET